MTSLHHKKDDSNSILDTVEVEIAKAVNDKFDSMEAIDMIIRKIASQHGSTTTKSQVSQFKIYRNTSDAKMQMREVLNSFDKVIHPKTLKMTIDNFAAATLTAYKKTFMSAVVQSQKINERLGYIHVLLMVKSAYSDKTLVERLLREEKDNATIMYKKVTVLC